MHIQIRQSVRSYGAVGDGVADDTEAFRRALDGPDSRAFVPEGVYRITDTLTISGKALVGEGRTKSVIKVDDAFNMSAVGIIRFLGNDNGGGLQDIQILGEQPSDPAYRFELVPYPVAVNGNGVPRLSFNNVRIAGMINGFSLAGNTGGLHIGRLEIGAIGTALHFDGAKDFCHLESVHHWPFGFTSPNQIAIWSDGLTEALKVGPNGADGFVSSIFSAFRSRIKIEPSADRILPLTFGQVQLDGDGAVLSVTNGRVQIGQLYSTKSVIPTEAAISVSGGRVDISMAHISGGEDSPQVAVSGGQLRISGGEIFHNRSSGRAAAVTGGALHLKNMVLRWPNTTLSAAFVHQSGSGILVIDSCDPEHPTNATPVAQVESTVPGTRIDATPFPGGVVHST